MEVDCLSCNRTSEAGLLRETDPRGEWECPYCGHGAAEPSTEGAP